MILPSKSTALICLGHKRHAKLEVTKDLTTTILCTRATNTAGTLLNALSFKFPLVENSYVGRYSRKVVELQKLKMEKNVYFICWTGRNF